MGKCPSVDLLGAEVRYFAASQTLVLGFSHLKLKAYGAVLLEEKSITLESSVNKSEFRYHLFAWVLLYLSQLALMYMVSKCREITTLQVGQCGNQVRVKI